MGQTPVLQYHFNWKTLSAMAGVTWWNFYFRLFPGAIRGPQIIEFLASVASHSRQVADCLGRFAGTSQPRRVGLREPAAGSPLAGVSSRLCAGTESGRVPVVALETTRVAEPLPAELRATEPLCPQSPAPDAEASLADHRLLAAGGIVSYVTILCNSK